jgi:autotransporter-associated beta strand protein
MFKKIIGMCGLLLLIQSAHAQFSFPVYEPFAYDETNRLGTTGASGTNWTTGSSVSGSSSIITSNASLSFPGIPADPSSPPRGLSTVPTSTSVKYEHAPFTAQTNGTVYCSFLLNIPNITNTANTVILTLSLDGSSSTKGGASVWLNPSGQLQLAKNNTVTAGPSVSYTSAATNTAALASGNTYLVVMAYKFNTNSSDDEVDLWLNPASLGNNSSIPAPTLSVTNGTDVSSLVCLFFYQAIGNIKFYVDEIRVDNNWAGVTPASPSPGPTFNVTGGGAGCPGDTFAVGLSGSVMTNNYLLYINSAFSGQTVTGNNSAISFGPQSVSGVYTVLASNTASAYVGWMNTNATVSVLAGPIITTQPAPALVATNGTATFTVTATGNGLNYQWYKNGTGLSNGGHVSGSQTSILIISPATTADAATAANGYYVIITNSCGLAATSTPIAALTLQPAGNLVWQGGNPNTNWDLATTANWTNSAGSFVVFNAGDNVTFDDSSTNQVVTLVGSVAPTSVTDNSSLNYFFTGGGSISGSGSLLMNGSGILTISNANSYTGGSTISSGTVVVKDPGQMALGVGTVTLAGGKLEIGLKSGAATVGLSNINVTANSTLQFDGAGSYAFNVLGALTGSPGATLTIYGYLNNSSTPDRIRLYGIFTNNAPIVITGLGDEVEIAPYNTTNGYQVYNGVISGNGGRFVPRGAGNVIFNAANTFNDNSVQANGNGASGYSVLLSSGNVGVGADSVSSSPPTIDSSPLGTGILGIKVGAEGGTCSLFASGGAHTVANLIAYTSATNTVTLTLSGSNNLTLAGSFTLSGADGTGNTNRTINVNNTALTTISGVISDAGLGCGIIKIGSRTLVLSATNTYAGPTTVSNGTLLVNGQIGTNTVTVAGGTLGGSGTILGPVTVSSAGTLAPDTSAIGTLTINNSLTLNGNLFFKVNKSLSPSQSNDIAVVTGTLANGGTGTLTVSNAGPALVVGDKFKLFNQAVANSSALGVSGGGVLWANNLQVDGSISVTSLTVPTPVINSVILQDNGTNLVFSGTNGTAGGAYSVLSSTNLTTPLANWVLEASGTFNGTGFSYTNIITPDVPVKFLLLRVP